MLDVLDLQTLPLEGPIASTFPTIDTGFSTESIGCNTCG